MNFCRVVHIHIHNYFDDIKTFDGVKAGIKKQQGMLTENLIYNIKRTTSKLKKPSITATTKISKILIDAKRKKKKKDGFWGFVCFTY